MLIWMFNSSIFNVTNTIISSIILFYAFRFWLYVLVCVGLFVFILLGTLCATCTWRSVYFFRFGMFSAIISSNTFSIPFSLSSPSVTPIMWLLTCLMLSHRSLCYFPFFPFVFLSVVWIGWFPLFYLPDHLCVLLCHLVCYLLLLECFFKSQILNYLFLIESSLYFLVLYKIDLCLDQFFSLF